MSFCCHWSPHLSVSTLSACCFLSISIYNGKCALLPIMLSISVFLLARCWLVLGWEWGSGGGLEADCHNSFITLNITPPALSPFFRSLLTPLFSSPPSIYISHLSSPHFSTSLFTLQSTALMPSQVLPPSPAAICQKVTIAVFLKKPAKCICILFPTSTAWPSVLIFIAHWQTVNGSQWCF